jgi:hypothetical protein
MPSIFLLHLEEHDDRFSLRDRLHWAKTRRVLLIWPARKRVRLQVLDLKFLQFHARRLGAELGIVSRRAEVRAMAKALGIPAFAHLRQAQRRPWPAPPKRLPHSSRRIKRPVARRTRPAFSPFSPALLLSRRPGRPQPACALPAAGHTDLNAPNAPATGNFYPGGIFHPRCNAACPEASACRGRANR